MYYRQGITNAEFLQSMVSTEEIQDRINQRYDRLYTTDHLGQPAPFVCSFCDEHVINERDRASVSTDLLHDVMDLFEWKRYPDPRRNGTTIESQYQFKGKTKLKFKKNDTGDWLINLCLSPRGTPCRASSHGNAKWGFSSCKTCKAAIKEKRCPMYAIINKNYVGECPLCIETLRPLEIAVLSPVKNYGYCYVWSGSDTIKTMALKGSLTFMRVERKKITKAMAQLDGLGLKDKILILCTGRLTKAQQQKAMERSEIRVDKCLDALKWLIANNHEWKDQDFER